MGKKVTDTIKQDLRYQVRTFSELPFRLTLGGIAKFYSVSLTPVRQVVEELIEENTIIRKPNGRLGRVFIPSGDVVPATVKVFKKPLKENAKLDKKVVNHVIKLCLDNYSPYLREEATARKYNTGRTIIRQVFSRLAGAGLLEHVPRCGWKVRHFREKDMLDYLEIREILEVKALELARPYFVEEDLKWLLEANSGNQVTHMAEIDNNLHDYWVSRCDNLYIQDFFKRNNEFFAAIFDYAALGETVKSEMALEHRNILNCLLNKDWKQAETYLIRHIRDQKRNVLRLIKLKSTELV